LLQVLDRRWDNGGTCNGSRHVSGGLNEGNGMSLNLRNAFGLLLIAVGLVAVPIPIVPGLPLIAAGTALLGHHHPLIRSCRTWLQKRGVLKGEKQRRMTPSRPQLSSRCGYTSSVFAILGLRSMYSLLAGRGGAIPSAAARSGADSGVCGSEDVVAERAVRGALSYRDLIRGDRGHYRGWGCPVGRRN
jgi:hypothetical protein